MTTEFVPILFTFGPSVRNPSTIVLLCIGKSAVLSVLWATSPGIIQKFGLRGLRWPNIDVVGRSDGEKVDRCGVREGSAIVEEVGRLVASAARGVVSDRLDVTIWPWFPG